MRWVCVLVRFVSKNARKNATSLRFYPMYRVIEKHLLAFFLRFLFFLCFTLVFDTNMLISKTREKREKN